MMPPDPIPPRNRLLALEQELQSRRPKGTQRRKQHHRQAPPNLSHAAEAMAVEPPPTPTTAQPSIPRSRKPPATVPQPPTSNVSPWQVLADRLTQRDPIRYSAPTRKVNVPPPDFTQESSPRLVPRSPKLTPSELPPTAPTATRRTPPPPPVSVAQSVDSVPSDDDPPLANWQDLATQIRQSRSPQLALSPSPNSIAAEPSLSSQSAAPISTEPLMLRLNSGNQEDMTDNLLGKQLAKFAHANATDPDYPATAAMIPASSATETALAPPSLAETGGALVPQSSADRGTLARYSPNVTCSLLAVLRSPQLQRAIPFLAGFILPCVLFKAQFLPSNHSSQVSSTGDSLCVLPKTDSRI